MSSHPDLRCTPHTATGPGRCGKPAAWAVDHCPDWGATWDRTMTLYLCSYHAWVFGWHYREMRCLGCGATVRDAVQHICEEGTNERAAEAAGEADGDAVAAAAAGVVAEAPGLGWVGEERT